MCIHFILLTLKGYVGKLYLDQSWLTDPTADWKLDITFKSQVAEFKVSVKPELKVVVGLNV